MMTEDRERTRRYIERLDRARASLRDEVEADVADTRHLTLKERGEWLVRLCADARSILLARPDGRRFLDQEEPPAPDFEAKWKRLRDRYRDSQPR